MAGWLVGLSILISKIIFIFGFPKINPVIVILLCIICLFPFLMAQVRTAATFLRWLRWQSWSNSWIVIHTRCQSWRRRCMTKTMRDCSASLMMPPCVCTGIKTVLVTSKKQKVRRYFYISKQHGSNQRSNPHFSF